MKKMPIALMEKKVATALEVENGHKNIYVFENKNQMHDYFRNVRKPASKKSEGYYYGELPVRQARLMAADELVDQVYVVKLEYNDAGAINNGVATPAEMQEIDEATVKITKSHSALNVALKEILTWVKKEKAAPAVTEKAATEEAPAEEAPAEEGTPVALPDIY